MTAPDELQRCGAPRQDGTPCQQPAMANGKCRIHGGKTPGAVGTLARARLYREHLTVGLDQELFDRLVLEENFADLRPEIAALRMVIHRCIGAIASGQEPGVPMRVLPQYVEKLLKLIERMSPRDTQADQSDKLDQELEQIMTEERLRRELDAGITPDA